MIEKRHLVGAIKIYAALLDTYEDTHLGGAGLAERLGLGKHNRRYGSAIIKELINLGFIEHSRTADNVHKLGQASWGHDPEIDIHSPKVPYRKKGRNFHTILKLVV